MQAVSFPRLRQRWHVIDPDLQPDFDRLAGGHEPDRGAEDAQVAAALEARTGMREEDLPAESRLYPLQVVIPF